MISRIHLSLPNAYKLMCFDRNIDGNRDVKFLECDYLLEQQCLKLTLVIPGNSTILRLFKFSAGTRISGFIFASKNVERSKRM